MRFKSMQVLRRPIIVPGVRNIPHRSCQALAITILVNVIVIVPLVASIPRFAMILSSSLQLVYVTCARLMTGGRLVSDTGSGSAEDVCSSRRSGAGRASYKTRAF